MKTRPIYLMLKVVLILFVGSGFASPTRASASGTVRLTAADVTSAGDIEVAIHQATQWGTRPGTVILDGSQGPFVYQVEEGNDYTINIFYSNVTLIGKNNAVFTNSEGIFFDELPADHIQFKNFTMHCTTDCIISGGTHQDVQIQNVTLYAVGLGIQVAQTQNWSIRNNKIMAGGTAVQVIDAQLIKIIHNRLTAYIPVMLQDTTNCQVTQNDLKGQWQGVLLTSPSSANMVNRNRIKGVESAGIALEPGTSENMIIRNQVTCALGVDCLTVDADEQTWLVNHIVGNRP